MQTIALILTEKFIRTDINTTKVEVQMDGWYTFEKSCALLLAKYVVALYLSNIVPPDHNHPGADGGWPQHKWAHTLIYFTHTNTHALLFKVITSSNNCFEIMHFQWLCFTFCRTLWPLNQLYIKRLASKILYSTFYCLNFLNLMAIILFIE